MTLSAVAHFCNSNPHSLSFPLGVEGPLIHHSETLLSYDVPTSSCMMLVPQLVGFLWEAVVLTQVDAGECHWGVAFKVKLLLSALFFVSLSSMT